MGLPLILPMAILTILKYRTIDYSIRVDVKTGITLAAMAVDDIPMPYSLAVVFTAWIMQMSISERYFSDVVVITSRLFRSEKMDWH